MKQMAQSDFGPMVLKLVKKRHGWDQERFDVWFEQLSDLELDSDFGDSDGWTDASDSDSSTSQYSEII